MPLVNPPPAKTTQKGRFIFAYVSQYDTKYSQNNNCIYTNSTISFPLLFKNAIRNSLSQKLLPKNWFGNGTFEKNGTFFWRQPFLRKAQTKKKNLATEVRKNLFYKINTIKSFLYKKNRPKS